MTSPMDVEQSITFTKQPIKLMPSLTFSDGVTDKDSWASGDYPVYDANKGSPSPAAQIPVSLLTTLLQSPDHKLSTRQTTATSGSPSTHSSAPSTALSSPMLQRHGIIHQQPTTKGLPTMAASILRRDSTSASSDADGAVDMGLGMSGLLERLAGRLDKVDEQRERIARADELKGIEASSSFSRLTRLTVPAV